jgi:PAS domain-containing protein
MWAVDANSFRFVVANDDAVELYGYVKPALLLLTFFDVLAPEERERFRLRFATQPKAGDAGEWTCNWPDQRQYRLRFGFYETVIEGNLVLLAWAVRLNDHPVMRLPTRMTPVERTSPCLALD